MKRLFCLLFCAMLVVGFSGCGSDSNKEDNDKSGGVVLNIEDYYPLDSDMIKIFEGGFQDGGEVRYVDKINGDIMQERIESKKTSMASVVKVTEDAVVRINIVDEFYDYEDLTGEEGRINDILMKSPLELGASWKIPFGNSRSVTGINVSVNTPAGDFRTLEITTHKYSSEVIKTYYAEGIGLVKQIRIFTVEEEEVQEGIVLKEIK